MRSTIWVRVLLASAALVFAMGHGGGGCGGDDDESEVLGPLTGAECPPGSSVTYASFGKAFMESYCVRCHDAKLTGDARQGATAYHDFDTVEGVRAVGDHIDQTAGSGPNATNMSMPPGGPMPTLAERQQLAEWIACGAP